MESSEVVGGIERHRRETGPEDEHVLVFAQVEVAHTTYKQISDGEVEQAPRDIECGRGQSHSRRRGEGALEGMPRDSIAEMGQSVCEERAPEEVRHKMVPAHQLLLVTVKVNVAGAGHPTLIQ